MQRSLQTILVYAITAILLLGLVLTKNTFAEAGVDFGNPPEKITVAMGEDIPATKVTPGHWEIVQFNRISLDIVSIELEARPGLLKAAEQLSNIPFELYAKIPGRDDIGKYSKHPFVFRPEVLTNPNYNAPDYTFQKYNRSGIERFAEIYQVGISKIVAKDGQKLPSLKRGYQWKETSRVRGGIVLTRSGTRAKRGQLQPDIVRYVLDIDPTGLKHGEKISDRYLEQRIIPSFLWKDQAGLSEAINHLAGARKAFEKEVGRPALELIPEIYSTSFMLSKKMITKDDHRPKALLDKGLETKLSRRIRNARPAGPRINKPVKANRKFR